MIQVQTPIPSTVEHAHFVVIPTDDRDLVIAQVRHSVVERAKALAAEREWALDYTLDLLIDEGLRSAQLEQSI